MKRHKFFTLLTLLTLLATFVPMASASPPRPQYTLPEGSAPERLDVQDGVTAVPSGKTMARGEVRLWLELAGQPLVAFINASGPMTPAAQLNYRNVLDAKQSTVAAQAEALGAVELARMNYLVNLVAVRAPASSVAALRAIPGVVGVYPVVNGAVDLVNSVPWIGAERAQEELGFTGDGVTIAIIDTGIDYTHASFGGPGTEAAYTEAMTGTNAMVITDTFATGWSWPDPRIKVITGTDFVGPYWDGDTVTALSPDPDPLDDGPGAGHGTHVGSTAAGLLVTDTAGVLVGQGVAPDADLFAYKVCSSVSTSCDGIAMVQGMEQAVIDGADVINMSIGATYGGAYESYPTTVALTNAAEAGLLVAVSSGNSGNLPYITGAPSVSSAVLSTASSNAGGQVGTGLQVDAPASIADTYLGFDFDWAPDPTEDITAPMVYVGEGCLTTDYPPDLVVTGTIALILRGNCNFDLKILNAETMGAVAGVVFTANPGDAPFAGGGDPIVSIPGMMISNQDGTLISNTLASEVVTATIGPDIIVPRPEIADTMSSFSSRGPRIWDNHLKPNVTAPGSSIVAAGVGEGTGSANYSGTSMASPHNAGTMALMREKYPDWPVERIYNAIVNTVQPELYTDVNGGTRAPVALQGAGLIQADAALETTTIAWDEANDWGALSFGYQAVSDTWVMTKTVRLWNTREVGTPGMWRTYDIAFTNIFTDDEDAGVMVKIAPERIGVTDGMSATFDVGVHVDAADLKEWMLNGGSRGGNGNLMTDQEFDGHIVVTEVWGGTGMPTTDEIVMPLYLLPHKASDVAATPTTIDLAGYTATSALTLDNSAAYTGTADVYAWVADDPIDDVVTGTLDIDKVGVSVYNTAYGPMFEFAIVAEQARAHPAIAEFDIVIDVDKDGAPDVWVWNQDYFGDGTSVVLVFGPGGLSLYYYLDTDLNSKVMRFPVLAAQQLGMDGSDMSINFYVEAWDPYNGLPMVDFAPDAGWISYDGNNPKFYVDNPWPSIAGSEELAVAAWQDGHFASPDQMGMLVVYRDQDLEVDAITINVADTGASTCPVNGRTDVGVKESFDVTFSTAVTDTDSIEFTLQRMGPIGTGTLEFPDLEVTWSMTDTVATVSTDIPANGILMVLGQAYELSHDGGAGTDGTVFPANDWYFVYANRTLYLPLVLKAFPLP